MNRWPLIVFALRREAMFFRRAASPRRLAHCPFATLSLGGLADRPVLLLETGIGPPAVEAAFRWTLDLPFRPALVLSAGFSGALQPEQRVGDLLLATEVVDTAGSCWPVTWPGTNLGLVPRGRLLTAATLIADPREKQRLGQLHEARAVDMETAVLAHLCSQQHLPFGCLRVISDDTGTPLSPHLVDLLSGGQVSPARLAGAVLRNPLLCRELWRLARQSRTAARRLSDGLQSLLSPQSCERDAPVSDASQKRCDPHASAKRR